MKSGTGEEDVLTAALEMISWMARRATTSYREADVTIPSRVEMVPTLNKITDVDQITDFGGDLTFCT